MLSALLGLESRATILENPNISLRDPAVWQQIFGDYSGTESGVAVSERSALGYPPAWQAVNLISGDIAAMPFDLYRRRPDISPEAREKATDHPAHRLVRWDPYPGWHSMKFWRRMMVHALLWNNSYAVIQRDPTTNEVVSMLPLLPDRTKPEVKDGVEFFMSEVDNQLVPFAPSQILHIEGITIEGTADCETVSKLRDSIGLGLAAQKFASKFFRRGGRIGGVLEIPAEMKKIAADNVATGFRNMYESGPDAAFMTFVARDNVKFHKAQFNAEEAQMQGTREEQALDASRIWGVPPHKLGIQNTVSYNSLEQENRSYHSTALVHWTTTIAGESRIKLIRPDEQGDYYFEHNTASLLGTDLLSAVTVAEKEIGMGTLTRNEWRAKQNRLPIEGGDEPILSQNLKTQSEIDSSAGGMPEDEEEELPPVDDEAVRSVLVEAIDRGKRLVTSMVRNRAKPKRAEAFCEWFDQDLMSQEFSSAVRSSAHAYAVLSGQDTQQIVEYLTHEVVLPLRRDIETCLNTCSQQQLAAAVADVLAVHLNKNSEELLSWKSETISQ